MAVEQMDSPYGYTHAQRPPSANEEREPPRPKPLDSEYSEMDGIRQTAPSQSSSYQLSKPSASHSRYIGPDLQRYPEPSSYSTNPNPPPLRLYGDHGRPPVYGSSTQPLAQFGSQRLADDAPGGGGPYASATSIVPRGAYDSRAAYGMQSSQGGPSPYSGNHGQLPWAPPAHSTSQSGFGPMSTDPHQSTSIYQSSVSPVIPTGGMPFPRSAGTGQSRTAGQSGDESYDGRTRNAKAQKRHREKRKAHVKHVSRLLVESSRSS